MRLRQPIVVVLGHVDHGKTSLLDRIRGTTVAAREPGAISQHIGASFVPPEVLEEVCGSLLKKFNFKLEIPGLLFIDTPGHAAFSNLRRRGGGVADIAILVIDLAQGVQPQTVESIDILKARRTPFVIAANKLDITPGWRNQPGACFLDSMATHDRSVMDGLDQRIYNIAGTLSYHKLQCERFDRIKDFTKTVAIVPVSAKTSEGIPDLLTILTGLTQQFLKGQLAVGSEAARGTVLEVLMDPGIGPNVNAIIYDGILRENDWLVVGGRRKPILTRIRALLIPKPLDEIRDPRQRFKPVKSIPAAAGVKIVAPGLDEAIAGGPLYGAKNATAARDMIPQATEDVLSVKISTDKDGVVLKTDTLGSLEAIAMELQASGVPIRIGDVGDISKRDIVEATTVKRNSATLGVVLGFNVKLLPDAEEEAHRYGVKIFQDQVIYHLIESYQTWVKSEVEAKVAKSLETLVRPGKIRILPGFIFRRNDPAIFGVEVLLGRVKGQCPIVKGDGALVGRIVRIQDKGQTIHEATRGMQVAVSMREPTIGRHIREGETLYVGVPEDHAKQLLEQYQSALSEDEVQALREYVEVMRKNQPYFGFSLGI